jgi:hypothetical protein
LMTSAVSDQRPSARINPRDASFSTRPQPRFEMLS